MPFTRPWFGRTREKASCCLASNSLTVDDAPTPHANTPCRGGGGSGDAGGRDGRAAPIRRTNPDCGQVEVGGHSAQPMHPGFYIRCRRQETFGSSVPGPPLEFPRRSPHCLPTPSWGLPIVRASYGRGSPSTRSSNRNRPSSHSDGSWPGRASATAQVRLGDPEPDTADLIVRIPDGTTITIESTTDRGRHPTNARMTRARS